MDLFITLLFFASMLAAWVLIWRRMQKGRFSILEDSSARFVFVSDCGRFTLHRQTGKLAWTHRGKASSMRLDEVKGVDYLANEGGALGLELLNGFGFTDLFHRYQDSIEYHAIDIVTHERGRVPVFRGARWQRREFLAGPLIALQDFLFVRTGLLRDVEQQAERALDLLLERLGTHQVWR